MNQAKKIMPVQTSLTSDSKSESILMRYIKKNLIRGKFTLYRPK